jgi:hypothetical protein
MYVLRFRLFALLSALLAWPWVTFGANASLCPSNTVADLMPRQYVGYLGGSGTNETDAVVITGAMCEEVGEEAEVSWLMSRRLRAWKSDASYRVVQGRTFHVFGGNSFDDGRPREVWFDVSAFIGKRVSGAWRFDSRGAQHTGTLYATSSELEQPDYWVNWLPATPGTLVYQVVGVRGGNVAVGSMVQGKREGQWLGFYEGGTVLEWVFCRGVQHGITRSWNQDGRLRTEEEWSHGHLTRYVLYLDTGEKWVQMFENDQLHGPSVSYWPNGDTNTVLLYENGALLWNSGVTTQAINRTSRQATNELNR